MIVLGFDPGLANLGYGVVRTHRRGGYMYVTSGVITTNKDLSYPRRLEAVFDSAMALSGEHSPDVLVIERLPYMAEFKAASRVSAVCGLLALVAGIRECDFVEYSPKAVKVAVTGSGASDKASVIHAVTEILGMVPGKKMKDHAADALAVALTHLQQEALT